jgi:integrase/recombinase XerD
MTPIAPHITAYLKERLPVGRGASDNTCASYAYAFKLLFEYASKRLRVPPSALCLEQLDAPLVMGFLNHLEGERGNGPGSRNSRLAAVRSFMHFLEYRAPAALDRIRRILAIPAKKAGTRLVRHLTVEEIKAILDAPEPMRRDGIRDRAMLYLCFAGGLRVSELVGVRIDQLTLHGHAAWLCKARGEKSGAFLCGERW